MIRWFLACRIRYFFTGSEQRIDILFFIFIYIFKIYLNLLCLICLICKYLLSFGSCFFQLRRIRTKISGSSPLELVAYIIYIRSIPVDGECELLDHPTALTWPCHRGSWSPLTSFDLLTFQVNLLQIRHRWFVGNSDW